MATPTIMEIKEDILQRAWERQANLQRGAYDVPLRFTPLPLARLLDQLSQLEYRRDFLDLAVPPPHPALSERVKRFFKSLVCKCLRWLLIRQVEFNSVALQQARTAAELAALADKNYGDFAAALTALRLQVYDLGERISRLEGYQPGLARNPVHREELFADKNSAYQVYLHYIKNHAPILVAGCGQGDFLKLLISEGISAQGIESDAALAEFGSERELPVACASTAEYLERIADGSLGGIYLNASSLCLAPQELGQLLGRCWTKLEKGGILLVEAPNLSLQEPRLPLELLHFLLESHSFTILDSVFSLPTIPEISEIAQVSSGRPFNRQQYHDYTILGCK